MKVNSILRLENITVQIQPDCQEGKCELRSFAMGLASCWMDSVILNRSSGEASEPMDEIARSLQRQRFVFESQVAVKNISLACKH